MGILLILLLLVSIIIFIVYIAKNRKNVKAYVITALAFIVIMSCAVFSWYISPFKIHIPTNPAIKIRSNNDNFDTWIEDQKTVSNIVCHLESLEIRRELVHYDGIFSMKLSYVRADDYFIIELYDAGVMLFEMPQHIGDYCFVISNPENSMFIVPSKNNRNKYKIINAAIVKDELYKIALSAR
ncbi:MAG TPA: hypothetical protein DD738_15410 [Ruminiclostridium sp.]|jgi:hypothetical protein|nr:hypothetical protein [Ruminiclostridium sp.]